MILHPGLPGTFQFVCPPAGTTSYISSHTQSPGWNDKLLSHLSYKMMQSYRREPGRVKCKRDRKLREMMIQKDADGGTMQNIPVSSRSSSTLCSSALNAMKHFLTATPFLS